MTEEKRAELKRMVRTQAKAFGGKLTDVEIMETLSISCNTYYRMKKEVKNEFNSLGLNPKKSNTRICKFCKQPMINVGANRLYHSECRSKAEAENRKALKTVKKFNNLSQLEKDVMKAKKHGVSYGKWMAMKEEFAKLRMERNAV